MCLLLGCRICAAIELEERRDESVDCSVIIESLDDLPIIPANLLNVLGILVCGLISIRTFFSVRMYTWSKLALLRGLSISISRD